MIILRQKEYGRFDLTPEEQHIWNTSIKREGKKPNIKELVQQAKKYNKEELSLKELRDFGLDVARPDMCVPDRVGPKRRWGNSAWALPGDHDDVLRSRIARKKLGKISTGVGIGLSGAALVGSGAYLIHRHNKKKKEQEKKEDK